MTDTSVPPVEPAPVPVLIYDGDCSFCKLWVEHWRALTGASVIYAPAHEVSAQYPNITSEQFARSVQLVMPDGTVYSGAHAVARLLANTSGRRWLLWGYQRIPGVARVAEASYRLIARHRNVFYWLTVLLWGRHITRPTYALSRWLFGRALGLVYLAAFLSMLAQVRGLIGSGGITPAAALMNRVAQAYSTPEGYFIFPSLVWFNQSDAFLQFLAVGGVVLALLLILDLFTVPVLALLWLFYLSLVVAGQQFFAFQWDILLLEVGFLAIFLDSFHILPGLHRQRAPSRVVIWLFRWLLFRLMFMSGVVKLASGDPTWHNLTALSYHYWTQPLPTPLAWVMAQLPGGFMRLSTLFTFIVELFVPFLFFAPRRLRFLGGALTITLQLLIILTGNYTFFNWLTIVLCILLFDDAALRRFFPQSMRRVFQPPPSIVKRIVALLLAVVLVFVGGIRLLNLLDSRISPRSLPAPLQDVYRHASGLYLANGYGLFAVMTTTRPEIILEGSMDGETWLPYEFPYKAGDVNRAPVYVAPYQPRLDWQMWFAALGTYQNNPWFVALVQKLLQGAPDVLALLAYNPFPDAPPTYIRAQLYQYHFTTAAERAETGAWWKREPAGTYLPPVSLGSFTTRP